MLKNVSLFLLLCLLCVSPIMANSAQTHWEGEHHSGVIQTGEESPLVVTSEELTFNIQEFPTNYYSNVEDAIAYSGSVEAKYTFHNPSDMNIKVRLLFPFATIPSYAHVYDTENEETYAFYDRDKYAISVNGKEIEKSIRYTYKSPWDPFTLEDIDYVKEEYIEHEFFDVDTPVYKYTYEVEKEGLVFLTGDTENSLEKNYLITGKNIDLHQNDDGSYRITIRLEEDDNRFDLYYIGTGFKESKFTIYEDYKLEKELKGKVTLIEKEESTFKDYVEAKRPEKVSSIDWYNAYVSSLYKLNGIGLDGELEYRDGHLLQWYDYTLEVGPNETIVNTVCAPLYPGMNTNYDPTIYEYTYLLTPASTFKEFKDLTIQINTPYFLNTCNLEGFEKNENGYVLKLDTLPDKDLEFILSEAEELHKKPRPARDYIYPLYYMLIIFGPVVLLGGIVIAVIYFSKSKQ